MILGDHWICPYWPNYWSSHFGHSIFIDLNGWFDSLTHWPLGDLNQIYICNFQMDFSDGWLRHLLWNCPNINVAGVYWWSVNIGSGNGLVPLVTSHSWANVDPDLCDHMVSLDQNELIGVIALVLQDIHHNIIAFCNISCMWTDNENNIKYMQFWCTQNHFYIIYSHLDKLMW